MRIKGREKYRGRRATTTRRKRGNGSLAAPVVWSGMRNAILVLGLLNFACGDDVALDAGSRDAGSVDAARDALVSDAAGHDATLGDSGGTMPEDAGADVPAPDAGGWLAANGWTNVVFAEVRGSVRIEYDIRATAMPVNAVAGVTFGRASRYQDLALIARLNEEGAIDARDGGEYVADESVPYEAMHVYHVSLSVDVAARRYDAHLSADGVTYVLREGAAFRSDRSVDSLDHLAFYEDEDRFEVGNLRVNEVLVPMVEEPPPEPAGGLWSVDFQTSELGNYTDARLRADWEGIRWSTLQDRASIVDEGGNRFVRVQYPSGSVGNSEGGAQWATDFDRIAGRNYDEFFVSYRLRFRPGFDFVLGGKLPGLLGGAGNTGGDRPNGSDGWSGRMMWRRNGEAVQYLYHPDQPGTYGEDLSWEENFPTGEWITVEHRIVMNTPGENDGVVQGWYNGVLALDRRDIRYRDVDTFAIDGFYFSTFFGGSGDQWAATRDEYIDYDDFVFSDEPITH